ncbi:AMP-binding protein [Streptomyces sp. NPDC058525]|uniref:AMP-binding protein n=1 Tax=Streptomyces sp. NPDC058525 TaxID=3346538 RepID=UPI0036543544
MTHGDRLSPPYGASPAEFLHEFLLAAAATFPDRPAVIEPADSGTLETTYRELATAVDALTEGLAALGVGVGDRVVLEADASAAALAALLACSTLGAAFIPVSPQTPRERLLSIVAATDPVLHLRDAGTPGTELPAATGTATFTAAGVSAERTPAPRPRRRTERSVTDPAYVIFTSGTTGRPKGVVMSHRAVVAFYRGMLAERLVTEHDRVASTSPLQFDFSLLNFGMALGAGAAVVPLKPEVVRWPRRFLSALHEAGVTQVNGVPSLWTSVLRRDAGRLAALGSLRTILFCGEKFPLPQLRRVQELRPDLRIVNCYGSTESMAASFAEVPRPLPADETDLSIGVAHPGAEMLLVDADGRVVDEPYATGEILLRTPALFSGYWDDPEATRAALAPDPLEPRSGQPLLRTGDLAYRDPSGAFRLTGRTDSQVQIRGNRVELGEVERRLLELAGTAAVAVFAEERGAEGTVLCAFVVPEPGTGAGASASASASASAGANAGAGASASAGASAGAGAGAGASADAARVRAFCAETLPAYMVPQEVRSVPALPVTANGKTDRAALLALL